MAEPTSAPVAAAGFSWFTAMVLAYLGIDYFALFAAAAGVLVALKNVKDLGVFGTFWVVVITTVVAAIMGQGVADFAHMSSRPFVMMISLLFGGAGQVGIQAAVGALIARVKKFGGEEGGTP